MAIGCGCAEDPFNRFMLKVVRPFLHLSYSLKVSLFLQQSCFPSKYLDLSLTLDPAKYRKSLLSSNFLVHPLFHHLKLIFS